MGGAGRAGPKVRSLAREWDNRYIAPGRCMDYGIRRYLAACISIIVYVVTFIG